MPPTATTTARARSARGQVSWVTLVLVALLAGGGYLGWVWVPLYVVNFQVKQVVHDYMNQAVKNRNDARLVENMVQKLRLVAEDEVVQADGTVQRQPAVELSPSEITWEADRTADPPFLHVQFEYTRQVRYPLLDRVDEKVFQIDMSQDIGVPNWGPSP